MNFRLSPHPLALAVNNRLTVLFSYARTTISKDKIEGL